MNKCELITKLTEKTGINKKLCKSVLEETINTIKECFYLGIRVSIKDFGIFEHKEMQARKRYVPSLKGIRYEKQKIVPRFRPSKNFYGKLL